MVVATPPLAGSLQSHELCEPATRSGSPTAALGPTAAAWPLDADGDCCGDFATSYGASPSSSDPDLVRDGMCGWGGEGGESCHSGLPLSVPLPAAMEGGRPSAVDCSWGSCSPAADGSLSPPVSPANSGDGSHGGAAACGQEVLLSVCCCNVKASALRCLHLAQPSPLIGLHCIRRLMAKYCRLLSPDQHMAISASADQRQTASQPCACQQPSGRLLTQQPGADRRCTRLVYMQPNSCGGVG